MPRLQDGPAIDGRKFSSLLERLLASIVERDLHVNYVSKDDYRQDILDLKDMVKQIFDKLDRKADK